MQAADYIVDFRYGPGVRGGEVVAAGLSLNWPNILPADGTIPDRQKQIQIPKQHDRRPAKAFGFD